jgi:cytochrome c oxidase subunit II
LTAPAADLTSLVPGLVDTRHEYYRVFDIYVPIAIGVFAVIALTSLFLVIRNRRRAPEHASRRSNNEPLEGTYALFLACVVAFLLYLTYSAEHRTDTVASRERPSLTVRVVASKWEWRFVYPAWHITVNSGVLGEGTLVVPTGEAVRFTLTSVDVIHAFWIPEVRYKHDLTPGSTQSATLDFSVPGVFQGQCAEFCGLRHADMVFRVRAVSPARFRAWARSGGRAALS